MIFQGEGGPVPLDPRTTGVFAGRPIAPAFLLTALSGGGMEMDASTGISKISRK